MTRLTSDPDLLADEDDAEAQQSKFQVPGGSDDGSDDDDDDEFDESDGGSVDAVEERFRQLEEEGQPSLAWPLIT